jgi:hypothetical protein
MKALNKQAFKNELINIDINYIPNSTRYCHHHQNWVENTHTQLVEIFLKNNLMTKEELCEMEDIQENNENGNNNRNNIDDYLFQEEPAIDTSDNKEKNKKLRNKNRRRSAGKIVMKKMIMMNVMRKIMKKKLKFHQRKI